MASSTDHEARLHRWADFVALPDDDKRELIDGALVEVEVPGKRHEHVVAELVGELRDWRRANGGLVLPSGYKVRVSDTRGVMPDVQFYREGRSPPEKALEVGAPDLVVEVLSSNRRFDRTRKLHWYAEIGAPEYWIVDPEGESLERYVIQDGTYRRAAVVSPDDGTFEPDTFPGLRIDLRELFTPPA